VTDRVVVVPFVREDQSIVSLPLFLIQEFVINIYSIPLSIASCVE
jgi:hypothetical protein